jgi:hypothetical protein
MTHTITQNSASRKRQDSAPPIWHDSWVPNDYATTIHENLINAMKRREQTPRTLAKVAVYLDGPKKGKRVSLRSIQYLVGDAPFSPTIDLLAAVAAALDLHSWQLLVKGMDPDNPPVLTLTESERKLYREFQRLRKELAALPALPNGNP